MSSNSSARKPLRKANYPRRERQGLVSVGGQPQDNSSGAHKVRWQGNRRYIDRDSLFLQRVASRRRIKCQSVFRLLRGARNLTPSSFGDEFEDIICLGAERQQNDGGNHR